MTSDVKHLRLYNVQLVKNDALTYGKFLLNTRIMHPNIYGLFAHITKFYQNRAGLLSSDHERVLYLRRHEQQALGMVYAWYVEADTSPPRPVQLT